MKKYQKCLLQFFQKLEFLEELCDGAAFTPKIQQDALSHVLAPQVPKDAHKSAVDRRSCNMPENFNSPEKATAIDRRSINMTIDLEEDSDEGPTTPPPKYRKIRHTISVSSESDN